MSYETQATFYRAALLLGLIQGDEVIVWAEQVIHLDPEPPAGVFDLVLTPPKDLSAMRDALQPLADESESVGILDGLLDRTRADLESGRRSLADTMRVFRQMRQMVTLPDDVRLAMDSLENEHLLATNGMGGDVATVDARTRAWLAQFAGADTLSS